MPHPAAILTLLTFALAPPANAAGDGRATDQMVAPGTSEKIVLGERAGGFRRSFRLHVPTGADDGASRPLVVALHGGFANARILEEQTSFGELADRAGFYVVYPNGLGVFGLLRHWNGGYCCGKALNTDLDDPGFIDRVIEWTAARHAVDRKRVYVVGYSNGGMLAYWYATLRAEHLAGLGIWASSLGSLDTPERSWTLPRLSAPLPAFIAHGQDDPKLPYDTLSERKSRRFIGAVASADAWARANGCAEEPISHRARGNLGERRTWCADSPSPVVLLGLEDWGHDWPGPNHTDRMGSSSPLHEFHLAGEMWSFFLSLDPEAIYLRSSRSKTTCQTPSASCSSGRMEPNLPRLAERSLARAER